MTPHRRGGTIALFRDRVEAGRRLASHLDHLRGQDLVVVGLPRGGVPVAWEVANILQAPLDLILVRKLGLPFQPELAMGAIGEGGVRFTNDDIVRASGVSADELAAVTTVIDRVEAIPVGVARSAAVAEMHGWIARSDWMADSAEASLR